MFCSNCGKKVDDGAKFCWNCGSEITPHKQISPSEPEQKPQSTPPDPVEESEMVGEGDKKAALPKLPKKMLCIGGALLAVVLLVVLIVVLSAPKVVGEIPDPMYYFQDFGVSVDDYTRSTSAYLSISMEEEGTSSATLGYVTLLKSGAYPFTCVSEETSSDVMCYDFAYSGEATYNDPYSLQISIILNSSQGRIYLIYYDYSHFDFVSREQYDGALYIPSMESYLGVDWESRTEGAYTTYVYGDTSSAVARTLVASYAQMLCEDYGFTLDEDKVSYDRWLVYGNTPDTYVDITCNPTGLEFAFSGDITLLYDDAPVIIGEDAPASPDESAEPTATSVPAEQMAESVSLSYLFEKPANGVQDIRYWSNGSIQFGDDPLDMGGYIIYYLDCGKTELNTYINMLCQNGFTLVADYDRTSMGISGDKFIEYALVSDTVSGLSTRSGQYTKAQNHIDIWWESMHRCWRMEVVKGLELCDLGLRQGGGTVKIGTLGVSAESGLMYQDGYYTTEDGRLRSGQNEATIIIDGEIMGAEMYGLEKKSRNEYRFYMDGFGTGELTFSWDKRTMEAGSIFLLEDMVDGNPSLTLLLPGGDSSLSAKNTVHFSKLLIRVMYYDAEGGAVFYLYGETFSGHNVEALMAANLREMENPTTPEPIDSSGAEEISVSSDTTIRIKVGETVVLHCAYSEFGSMYHTYDWSSQGSAINISGSYNRVTVKGVEAGTAEISMTYHYTKDEPDVLTGITRHNGHSRSRTYTIIVE